MAAPPATAEREALDRRRARPHCVRMLVLRWLAFNVLFYANLILWLIFVVLPALLLPQAAMRQR